MSKPIGLNGQAVGSVFDGNKVVFTADAPATKILYLDPSRDHGLFISVAGASDVTFAISSDSAEAIAGGYGQYGAVKTATNLTADGYVGAILRGARAVKVMHVKNGAAADGAPEVALLGGRCSVRAVPNAGISAATADLGTLGDYTPITVA